MTVLTTWEAVPSRLYSLFASLADSPAGEDRSRFEALATPESLRNKSEEEDAAPTNLFSNALREAVAIGLVDSAEDKLRLTDSARSALAATKTREDAFRSFISGVLLDEKKAAETQQSAFMASLSWFLTKSPFKPISFKSDPTSELKADLGEKASDAGITVFSDFQNFLYWARYLGFATIIGGRDSEGSRDGRYVFPDPLAAIARALPAIFADQAELTVEQFVARLAAIYPVMENGSVRQDMIRSPELSRSGVAGSKLSQATSLALQRLESSQVLRLRRDADAPMIILDLGRSERRISHISRKSAS